MMLKLRLAIKSIRYYLVRVVDSAANYVIDNNGKYVIR